MSLVDWDQACRAPQRQAIASDGLRILAAAGARSRAVSHPSPEQIEAAVFGWLPEADAREIHAHATGCPTCGPFLNQDEVIQRRLRLLRGDEPRVDLAERVLKRPEQVAPRALFPRRPVGLALVLVALIVAGVLLASNGNVRRTMKRVRAIVIA